MILGDARPTTTRRVYAHVMRSTTADQVDEATRLLTRHRPSHGGSGEPGDPSVLTVNRHLSG
jgi:hypothetical protein